MAQAPKLTPDQINSIRFFLGTFSSSFTDDQLQMLADYSYGKCHNWIEAIMAFAFDLMGNNSIPLTNFKQGETTETLAPIYDRMKDRANHWYNLAGCLSRNQLPKVVMTSVRMWYVEFDKDAP